MIGKNTVTLCGAESMKAMEYYFNNVVLRDGSQCAVTSIRAKSDGPGTGTIGLEVDIVPKEPTKEPGEE